MTNEITTAEGSDGKHDGGGGGGGIVSLFSVMWRLLPLPRGDMGRNLMWIAYVV